MKRVVVDTNVRFSALVHSGRPQFLLKALLPPEFLSITSEILLAELRATLERKSEWSGAEIEAAIQQTAATSEVVFPSVAIDACRDPDDNRVLECAVAGAADLIVTGDKDLLVLNPFQAIEIVTVRQFLDSHGA